MTKLKANPIVNGKFWIIEEDGERVGTLTKNNDKTFMYCCDTGTSFFENERQLKNTFNDINWGSSISDKDTEKKRRLVSRQNHYQGGPQGGQSPYTPHCSLQK